MVRCEEDRRNESGGQEADRWRVTTQPTAPGAPARHGTEEVAKNGGSRRPTCLLGPRNGLVSFGYIRSRRRPATYWSGGVCDVETGAGRTSTSLIR